MLSSFKVRIPRHVQRLEKWLAILDVSVALFSFTCSLGAGGELVQKLYAVSATAYPGKQFDLNR